MSDEAVRACAVCGRILENVVGEGWTHVVVIPGETEHVVVPVRPEEIRTDYRCDFCSVRKPAYELPALDFNSFNDCKSIGDWAACVDCAHLIRRDDWGALVRRVKTSWQQRTGRRMTVQQEARLILTYRVLRRSVTGPLRPFGGSSADAGKPHQPTNPADAPQDQTDPAA